MLAIGYVTVSMCGVAAFALFFSTFTDSPLGATLGALAVLVASSLLLTLDAAVADRALPADPLLARVRRPLPRPDPAGATSCAGWPAGASTWACCWPPRGRTSRPRTSRADAGGPPAQG